MSSKQKWSKFLEFWNDELKMPANINCRFSTCSVIKQIYNKIEEIQQKRGKNEKTT